MIRLRLLDDRQVPGGRTGHCVQRYFTFQGHEPTLMFHRQSEQVYISNLATVQNVSPTDGGFIKQADVIGPEFMPWPQDYIRDYINLCVIMFTVANGSSCIIMGSRCRALAALEASIAPWRALHPLALVRLDCYQMVSTCRYAINLLSAVMRGQAR